MTPITTRRIIAGYAASVAMNGRYPAPLADGSVGSRGVTESAEPLEPEGPSGSASEDYRGPANSVKPWS